MLWLNDTREQIKKENPGLKITEIAKKGGEMWHELKDKSIWEAKAAKDKERYANEMKDYKPASKDEGGSGVGTKRKKESPSKKPSATIMAGSGFKSKEYISDESSSADSDGEKKKKKKKVINLTISEIFFVFENNNNF